MQIWIDKYSVRKHFVTFRHLQAHASPGLTGSAPVRATYDPGRRPTAMAYEISTTIEIAATPENVWAVLADLASYPQWHPMYQAVTGQLAAGSTLTITSTHPTSGRTMTAKVKVLTAEPDTELRWVSKLLGLTISEREFRLSSTTDGTSLVQAGSYRPAPARCRRWLSSGGIRARLSSARAASTPNGAPYPAQRSAP